MGDLFALIAPAFALADSGRLDEAAVLYRQAGRPTDWDIPPFFPISALAIGAFVAVALDEVDDLGFFRERLGRYRGHHVAGGAGVGNYLGPVELILGKCAAGLGLWDEAESDLVAAAEICRATGAPAFAVEADVARAELLQRRGDMSASRRLAARHLPAARSLGMTPWVQRLRDLVSQQPTISPRELEVARLVAAGKSNREIAERLVISERTAQNHVQHILTKLGFANRSQIAAWITAQRDE